MNNTFLSSVKEKDKEQLQASLVDLFHYFFDYHYYILENRTTILQLMSTI